MELQTLSNEELYKIMVQARSDFMSPQKFAIPEAVKQEVRRRVKSKLFFLGKYFLGNNLMTEITHQLVCDFFVQKDDTKEIGEQDWRKERLLLFPRGGFKALALDTKIPSPSGFVTMQDVVVGDKVFDENGKVTDVVGVSPVFKNRKCYEIEFSTGETVVADAEHLWETDARKDRDAKRNGSLKQKSIPRPSVKTTEEISRSVFCRKEHNHRVRVSKALELPDKEYIISPYVLGCWLGDGTSSTGQITIADKEIAEQISLEGEVIRYAGYGYRWVFNGGTKHKDYKKHSGKSFSSRLRYLDLLNNKHIPSDYLRGSYKQRLALLQGLMDTDGSVSKTGACSFSNINKELAAQVKQLVASLGMKPGNIGCYDAVLNKRIIGKFYVVLFTAYKNNPVFRLTRKLARLSLQRAVTLQKYRHIVAVREVESRPVKCITVASKNHLYLVGESYIPTHNSTIDVADSVQWILNFPDIRILYMTAADDLAVGLLDETKKHFVIRLDEPSFMNLFFPEFCVAEEDLGNQWEFTSPQRKIDRKEPTIMASSIGSTLSGFHFDVIKSDDSVSNKNSENEEQCQKVTKNFHINRKMLMPFGYIDVIGTRYDDMDMYGETMEKNVGELKTERGPCWELTDNVSTGLRILIGRAVVVKPDALAKGISFADAKEEECDLLFPEYLTFAFLKKEYHKDEISFEGQYNQNPRQKVNAVFDKPLLLKHTIPYTQLPLNGPISIVWDFAFSKKKGRDYSTGCVVIHNDKAQMFVIDLVRARFTPNALAKAVVDLAARYRPFVLGIEDAAGSRFLEGSIIAEARKTGKQDVLDICSRIDWFTPDQQKDAKRTRMASLHPMLMNDQLWFVAHLPHLEVLYDEFGRCLSSHHHDDIPDVISQQPRYIPRIQLMVTKKEISTWSREQADWNLLYEADSDEFGRPGMGYVQPVDLGPPVPDSPPAESSFNELPSILGSGLTG